MAAVSYCPKCNVGVDPLKDRCPSCGSAVRFRFKALPEEGGGRSRVQREQGRYITPPSSR